MPRAKAQRECVAHRLDCKLSGGSSYSSGRCSPVPKGGREPSIDLSGIFTVTPAEQARRDAERAALAAMTPAQRCAYRDGIPTPAEQLAAIRVQSRRILAELREIGV